MRTLRLTLLTLLIALSAHAAIRVTPETGIFHPVGAPIDGEQGSPVIATDGDQFLVLWINTRGLYVARVDAEGRLLSSRLAVPGTTGDSPTATWTGSVYLVTWNTYGKQALVSATFSKTGDLLSGPVAILGGRFEIAGLANNGYRALLLYRDIPGIPKDVRAAIFDADGRLIRTDVAIPSPGNAYPRISSDGEEFALVWGNENQGPLSIQDLHFLRMNEEGAAIGSPIDIGSFALSALTFVSGGGRYAIAVLENQSTSDGNEASRLTRFVVDARRGSVTKLPIVETTNAENLSMFWNGTSFVLVWAHYQPGRAGYDDIMTLPFSGADESVAPAAVLAWTGQSAAWASNGHQTLLVWARDVGLYYDGRRTEIYGALFDAAAPSADAHGQPTLLSPGWSRQLQPLMASSPTGSLVIWIEDADTSPFYDTGSTSRRLLGMRTDAAGAFIDAVPFEIATGVAKAAVVFAGDVFIVAWQKGLETAVRTVSRDGSLGLPVWLGPGGYGIAAASNGSTALVVFSESQSERLVGYRFDALGRQIDTSPLILGTKGYGPQAASNGSDFFVAWSTGNDWPDFPSATLVDVLGTRITAAGTVDAAPLPIAASPRDEHLFAMASDGRDYLVAYQWDRGEGFATKRVLREGQLDGTTAADVGTIIAAGPAYSIALAGDAAGYWSAYATGRGDAYSSNGTSSLLRLDKRGMPASSALPFASALSSATVGRLPGGAVRILYSLEIDDGVFAGTTMIFSRFAGDDGLADNRFRSRAARH